MSCEDLPKEYNVGSVQPLKTGNNLINVLFRRLNKILLNM